MNLVRYGHGAFAFLPKLSPEKIKKQIEYCLNNGWIIHVEHTADPDPRNNFWEMWGVTMLDTPYPADILQEIEECCKAHPSHYVRVNSYENRNGKRQTRLSFLVNRPEDSRPR